VTGPGRITRVVVGLLAAHLVVVPAAALADETVDPISTSVPSLGAPPTDARTLGITGTTSVALVEVTTGQVLVARDAARRRPVASAIKLVTALVVVDELPVGTPITIGDEVVGVEGSSYGLRPDEVRSVDELLAGLLLRSGNDVARALAVAVAEDEEAFARRMAAELARLGVDAQPTTASGLAEEDALSALELATVARAVLREPRLRSLVGEEVWLLADGRVVENRNRFLTDTGGATGLKTGFTSAAGFTLAASAERDGRELVAIVLGAGSDAERRTVATRLLEHGFGATRVIALDGSIELRTSSGPVRFAIAPTPITITAGDTVQVVWPRTLRPDQYLSEVDLRTADGDLGRVDVGRSDGRSAQGSASLGRALADGAYAAVRSHAIATDRPAALR